MDTVEEIGGLRVPDLADINATRAAIRPFIRRTPIFERDDLPGLPGTFQFKFELLQVAGTFKARGAFSSLLALDAPARAAGVTAISSGNHAVAVAYAAMRVGMSAKVVMVRTANPVRVAAARRFGAEVVLAEDAPAGFAIVREIEREEGRFFVHPFNSYRTILGTATLGAEWSEQACSTATGGLDAVIMAIGGGGLAAGAAVAFKLAMPDIAIYGVEPEGSDAMHQSFAAGGPVKMEVMRTIADSLNAPHTEAYSYGLCRRNLDDVVTVSDDELRAAMGLMFDELKFAVEPACAAALAAASGPLRERTAGLRVGILLCGSNTDAAAFCRHMQTD